MGFDVYMKWKGITPDEESAQITGYSIIHGHVGYLRWSYEEPNPVVALLKPWMTDDYPEAISGVPGVELANRLPEVEKAINSYDDMSLADKANVYQSFVNFTYLYEKKEQDGLEPTIEVR